MSNSDVPADPPAVVSVTVPVDLFNSAVQALMTQPASQVFELLYGLKTEAVPNYAEPDSGGE